MQWDCLPLKHFFKLDPCMGGSAQPQFVYLYCMDLLVRVILELGLSLSGKVSAMGTKEHLFSGELIFQDGQQIIRCQLVIIIWPFQKGFPRNYQVHSLRVLFLEGPNAAQRGLLRPSDDKWKFALFQQLGNVRGYYLDCLLWILVFVELFGKMDVAHIRNFESSDIYFVLGVDQGPHLMIEPSQTVRTIILSPFLDGSSAGIVKRTAQNNYIPLETFTDEGTEPLVIIADHLNQMDIWMR